MIRHIIQRERQPNFHFEPANNCIYCRRFRPEVELTKEHIIPDGIGGHLILPEASCRECARIIHQFESEVITNNFGDARDGWGIKSRKRRGKKRREIRTHYRAYSIQEYDDSVEEYPISSDMPISIFFETTGQPPTIFTGADVPTGNQNLFVSGINYENLPKPHRLMSRPCRTGNFTRFAAKVGHSYASAILGSRGFDPWLTTYILQGNTTNPYLIGTAQRKGTGERLHQIGIEVHSTQTIGLLGLPMTQRDLVVVYLELFAPLLSPVLEIVVGELQR